MIRVGLLEVWVDDLREERSPVQWLLETVVTF
jgi:hypothetical protein